MAGSTIQLVRSTIYRFEARLLQVLGLNQHNYGHPDFALDASASEDVASGSQDSLSILDIIRGNSILWAAVPKKKISLEKRWKRRQGSDKIRDYATPKKNITACLDCGHYHEIGCICGNCYQKVREETEAMREAMNYHDQHYNHPNKEVVYLYQGEDKQHYTNKYIVEMDKPRPSWWPKHLLKKVRSS